MTFTWGITRLRKICVYSRLQRTYFRNFQAAAAAQYVARMFIPIPPERVRATESQEVPFQEVPFRFKVSINSGGKLPIPPIFQTETE